MLEQVCEDFEVAFAKAEVPQRRGVLAEACQVLDALGEHARTRLVTWYCNTQLREYRQVFRGNDEAGSLDNIARRYSWFNRMLRTYDAEHAVLFPAPWRVNEMLANAFCETTREDYRGILQRAMRRADGQAPDVDLLLSCLQETLDFEHGLEQRFKGAESRSSMDTVTSGGEEKRHGFSQAISEAFEPYLSIWVESQDKQLANLIPTYRQQPVHPPDEEFHPQLVIPSSTELFHHYRVTLAQCAKLSTGSRLLELSQTFGKYLDAYAQQVLFYYLAQKTGGTTTQLEERIRSRVDEDLREKVDLQSQADAFMGVASAAVRALVHKTEVDCEPAWREMRNVPWSKMDSVTDHSGYVSVLLQRIRDRSQEILKYLHKPQYARAYCDHVVDSVTTAYITNLAASKPISDTGAEQMLLDFYELKKGLSSLSTLTPSDDHHAKATQAFVKRVNLSTAKVDPILKTLQVQASPPEGLVQMYLIHIRDRSEANFRKILDLKGIPKREQGLLVELFHAHKDGKAHEGLQASNPLIAALHVGASTAHHQGAASIGGLGGMRDGSAGLSTPSLPARFDPSQFGNALLNAARDAGDRIAAAPGLGVGPGSRVSSPPAPGAQRSSLEIFGSGAAGGGDAGVVGVSGGGVGGSSTAPNLNEGLKRMGNFFRRDVGGFGGFGRGAAK
ncbi:Vacuolar protein sorting-associated protein 53 [Teratosphaeria destructans]|uniref:Vacuolar protein sorting-associated protein 53 n=1 Tax=Teratosphaeria destructans TaxID=418781 RepID=A0A9W7SHX5_9PEZI|nr:Vacuolar protein sorting-associated protein 53 [Teratosphaeria destructans]